MLETMRRVLVVAMFAVVLVGLAPLLPSALGFKSAVVSNNLTNTWYPSASSLQSNSFISCGHNPNSTNPTWVLRRSNSYPVAASPTIGLFQCTNNWNAPVTVSISVASDPNSVFQTFSCCTGVTISQGATTCLSANAQVTAASTAKPASTVVYKGVVNSTSNADLYAEFYFTGTVRVVNGSASGPTTCGVP